MGQIGNAAAAAKADNTVQQATLSQLTTQRNALSGVSLDEEAANLTNYQRAYEAAAKIFSIVDQMMATALNLGVPTSVS
jgi:flagellar hook-associated protein 1 FlgK